MEDYDLCIIGAGPAGLFATFCAGLREINSITLEALDATGGQILKFYPMKDVLDVTGIPRIKGMDLASALNKQAETFDNKIELNSKVTDIKKGDNNLFTLEVNGVDKYRVKSILITTGIGSLVPTKLNVEGEDKYVNNGVFYTVNSFVPFKDKVVAVVGGGDSGFDWANQVAPAAKKIYVLEYSAVVKAAERSVSELLDTKKAQVFLNTAVKAILGDGKTVKQISLLDRTNNSQTTLDIDAVIIAIGHKAEINNFKSIKFDTVINRLKVDGDYSTSIPGIYAAGDVSASSTRPKMGLLASAGADAYEAINSIKKYINPEASLFGEHSTNLKL